jgi:very-short-patch-repair endonuclease
VTRSWAELPRGRVVRLHGTNADTIALSLDPLPDDAPAVVTYFADDARSVAEMVNSVLCELEKAAISLFPAWLPGAEGIDGPGGAGRSAVRALALRTASVTGHFGPFLADLAERSLHGVDPAEPSLRNADPAEPPLGRVDPSSGRAEPAELPFRGAEPSSRGVDLARSPLHGASPPSARRTRRSARFTPEVRIVGLARVLAASFGRSHASILVHVPTGLSATAEEVLVAGCEWLAHRGELGVWLTGAPLVAVDRVETMTVRLPPAVVSLARDLPEPAVRRPPAARVARTVTYPAVIGIPHPASIAEQALETALVSRDWATGRAWNQTYQSNLLTNPVRLDLLWREERCVVEVDGLEHGAPLKYAADRQRDVQLQLDGYAVLRFTNVQVMTDTAVVINQIKRFLQKRRLEALEG